MMIEVQAHGFLFEQWVRDTCFGGYAGGYGQAWDIPSVGARGDGIPLDFRGLPVSIKTAKYGSPIGLGDAIVQRGIHESFVMIVGYWVQKNNSEKWFEDIGVAKFTAASWNMLWGDLTMSSLTEIDTQIKNLDLRYSIARRLAQNWKRETAAVSSSTIVINPKIDSKRQRRLQCSLPFRVFWASVGRDVQNVSDNNPVLFGQTFPNPMNSPRRVFSRD